jgi:hypothetical protein
MAMKQWVRDRLKKQGKKSPHRFSWPSRVDGDRIRASESGVDTKSPATQLALDGTPPVTLPGRCSGSP